MRVHWSERLSHSPPYGSPPISPQTIGIVATQSGRRTTLWIADATEVDYDLFRGPARSWQVVLAMNGTDVTPIIEARSDTEPAESHPETVPAAVNIALVMASNRERVTVIW
jgi:hypothetical protein